MPGKPQFDLPAVPQNKNKIKGDGGIPSVLFISRPLSLDQCCDFWCYVATACASRALR
jgi:hypothetical protein